MRHLIIKQAVAAAMLASFAGAASAQTWTPLTNTAPLVASTALLLTDGTVMVQDLGTGNGTGNWWKLTPDINGSYVNGTWSQLATMPSGYTPLYYASAVLPNGQVIINGGEYNGGGGVWTTLGALYDPPTDTWVSVKPPKGWTTIGDAQSVVLPDGTYMLANCCTSQEVTLDLSTMAWTATGTGKADINDEEGWTLLPSGQVLTVDANNTADLKHTEILTSGKWASAGDTPQELPDLNTSTNSHELGPQMLRSDGTVVAIGATGYTAVYDIASATWTAGPTFPKSGKNYFDAADGPAALEPNGAILIAASPGVYKTNTKFFEFTKANTLKAVASTPNAKQDSSFYVRLLPLPNGQILETDFSNDVEIYTPATGPIAKLAPTILKFPATVTHGDTYTLVGRHLNGYSSASSYGDDSQSATNFPIARITNTATGHVFYARTANHSSMAVADPKAVTTQVTIPAGVETGASTIVAVANGISSAPFSITIK